MTVVEGMYGELRDEGMGHKKAVNLLARRIGVDRGTVQRVLARAQDERPKRRSRQG
jgi:hypothetical protein